MKETKPQNTQTCDCSCLKDLFRVQWDFCDCCLQRALQGCSFPELECCIPKSSGSSRQCLSLELQHRPCRPCQHHPIFCSATVPSCAHCPALVCERSLLLAQDKWKETSSVREQTRHKSSWEQRAILVRNTDENIPAFSRILGISRLSVGDLHSSGLLHSMRISSAPQRWRIFLWQIFHTGTDAVLRLLPPLSLQTTMGYMFFLCPVDFPLLLVHPISCQVSCFPLACFILWLSLFKWLSPCRYRKPEQTCPWATCSSWPCWSWAWVTWPPGFLPTPAAPWLCETEANTNFLTISKWDLYFPHFGEYL